MRALWKQGHQHHQIRQRKKPLIRVDSRSLRRPSDETKVPALRKIVDVLEANARQRGHFRICEDFLTGFHLNHWHSSLVTLMLTASISGAISKSNSRSVC